MAMDLVTYSCSQHYTINSREKHVMPFCIVCYVHTQKVPLEDLDSATR